MRKSLEYDDVSEEALGDDEHTESEDSRKLPTSILAIDTTNKRSSYIAGSGQIPPVPMSPLSSQNSGSNNFSPRIPPPAPPTNTNTPSAPVPVPGSKRTNSLSMSPVSPPPPPPLSTQAPAIPSRNLVGTDNIGDSSSEVTGYEADEDTDVNPSISVDDEVLSGSHTTLSSPTSRPPLPPVSGLGRSATVSHGSHSRSSNKSSHSHSQSYSQSPRAPPPPPPSQPLFQQQNPVSPAGVSSALESPSSNSGRDLTQQTTSNVPQQIKPIDTVPTPSSSSRFGFKRASSELSRNGSKRLSQASAILPEPVQELPFTIDLNNETSPWWTTNEGVPKSLLLRKDVRYEVETQELFKRNELLIVIRDIYVLFPDYSQEIITAEYAPQDPNVPVQIFFRKINTPITPRPEELEDNYQKYGRAILDTVLRSGDQIGKFGGVDFVGNVLKHVDRALLPVGTQSFGVPVYINKGNAVVRQFDEVHAGDIVTFKSAKFQGHKGGLHQKYNVEAGRNDVVNSGIIFEYDPAKRKMRVYLSDESVPGRVKAESFRIGDFKSGEVQVFRAVGREYVGW